MTMPIERARSIRWGWEFLWELKSATNLSNSQHAKVEAIIRHYPSPSEINQWAAASADLSWPMLAHDNQAASLTDADVPVCIDRGPTNPLERIEALADAFKFFKFELMETNSPNLTQTQRNTLSYVMRHFPVPREIDHIARDVRVSLSG